MSVTVFPIGQSGGLELDEYGGEQRIVRVGWSRHRIDVDAFAVWRLAHGLPERGRSNWTVEDLVEHCERDGIDDPAGHVEQLADAGLLAIFEHNPMMATQFVQRHRLGVLFVGLGNAPDRLDGHAIGVPGVAVAAVLDPDCYELWQWGSVAPTLWHSCEVRATVTAEIDRTADPADALAGILGDLRFLLAHGCAYLDVAG
jgi:hypothetical protein